MQSFHPIWHYIKGYFYLNGDKEPTTATIEQIRSGVEFRGANLWILIFAIFTASLGLNVNSTAVIIGAMLISPLMGPIIGMGLAVGINDFELMKRSMKSYLVATFISVVTATIYFALTPLNTVQSELLARTSPTIYDVLIALFGGLAGIVALSTKGKGNVLPGVAIATALMPPLCTAGFGLATGHWLYFLGAFYLFFINTVFISAATFVGVRMMKFPKKKFVDMAREKKVRRSIIAIVILTMCPSIYMTMGIVRKTIFNSHINKFVASELKWEGTQIIATEADDQKKELRVVAVGKDVSPASIKKAQERMPYYQLNGVRLHVIQGSSSQKVALQDFTMTDKNQAFLLSEQSRKIHNLEQQVARSARYPQLAVALALELRVLYPEVRQIAIVPVIETYTDTARVDSFTMAVITLSKPLNTTRKETLRLWLKERTKSDSLRLLSQ